MAKLVFAMNQSLDGYVDHLEMRPSPALFRHFIEQVRGLTGSVYGRRMYEVMRYGDDLEAAIRGLKARFGGEIEVGGPELARSITDLGLIDEYRLYFRPIVLGHGKPFFAGPRPPLRLVVSDLISEDALRLTYVPT